MDIADPNFLVKKAPKPRTPAQIAATAKGLAALKERRAALAEKVTTLKAKGPAPVPKPPKAEKVTAPEPVAADSTLEDEEEEVAQPPPPPVKAKKAAAAPPAFDAESMISAIASRVTESLGKKKAKRVVYEEESSSEEEIVVRRKSKKATPTPAQVPTPEPRAVPQHIRRSNVLSRLFDNE